MKPDAIGGQANMLLSARLIRGKPAGETTRPIYRTALPLRPKQRAPILDSTDPADLRAAASWQLSEGHRS